MSWFSESDVPCQIGKTFVVTGANTGLGFEASRVLAAKGARVIMVCREEARADAAAMSRIRQLTLSADLAFLSYD
jgi:NAD(P)-dependent dehydrogenase (short-subunit alcohol dehydrogenase family)